LRHYRFVPRLSHLEISGGFAGVHYDSHIRGAFDLELGYVQDIALPVLSPFARFRDVRAVAEHPMLDPALSLERALNLSGLRGTYEDGDPHEVWFSGEDGQGAPIRLEAEWVGRLLHLTGANEPPCCDFFQYEINAIAVAQPWADFDRDGRTTAADYVVWRDTLGSKVDLTADADRSGAVDMSDYAMWKEGYLDSLAIDEALAMAGAPVTSAVPEPASSLLALIASSAAGWRRRRR
jgi:hypothetical protein